MSHEVRRVNFDKYADVRSTESSLSADDRCDLMFPTRHLNHRGSGRGLRREARKRDPIAIRTEEHAGI